MDMWHRGKKKSFRILVGNPVVKRSLGKLQKILENNIKINLRETGSEDKKQFQQTQNHIKWQTLASITRKLVLFVIVFSAVFRFSYSLSS